jgi:hypothetical protein
VGQKCKLLKANTMRLWRSAIIAPECGFGELGGCKTAAALDPAITASFAFAGKIF